MVSRCIMKKRDSSLKWPDIVCCVMQKQDEPLRFEGFTCLFSHLFLSFVSCSLNHGPQAFHRHGGHPHQSTVSRAAYSAACILQVRSAACAQKRPQTTPRIPWSFEKVLVRSGTNFFCGTVPSRRGVLCNGWTRCGCALLFVSCTVMRSAIVVSGFFR